MSKKYRPVKAASAGGSGRLGQDRQGGGGGGNKGIMYLLNKLSNILPVRRSLSAIPYVVPGLFTNYVPCVLNAAALAARKRKDESSFEQSARV